jgi:hypothetical protein
MSDYGLSMFHNMLLSHQTCNFILKRFKHEQVAHWIWIQVIRHQFFSHLVFDIKIWLFVMVLNNFYTFENK